MVINMKKRKVLFGIFLSFALVLSTMTTTMTQASAATILGTKSTEYGTITAKQLYSYTQECSMPPWVSYEFTLQTSINSSVLMRRVTTGYEAVYQDTGLPLTNAAGTTEGSSGQHSTTNSNSDTYSFAVFGESGRSIALYTSHQVSYTKSYVLYTVSTYCYTFW